MSWRAGRVVALMCLFISSGLTPSAGAQEVGIDRPGHDLAPGFDLPVADAVFCEQACNQNAQCVAYTYVRPNTIQGPKPRCWLKADVPLPVKNPCCVSGVKRVALYRFWNSRDHFYTTHCEESAEVSQCSQEYAYEGVAGYVSIAKIENTALLYRMYNKQSGDHFYTVDRKEVEGAKPAWTEEGTEGYVAASRLSGTRPFFRMFNPNSGDHFYTADSSEKDRAALAGWRSEGTIGFIWETGANRCPPPPPISPEILAFSQGVLTDDQALLSWSFSAGRCCVGSIAGYDNVGEVPPSGTRTIHRARKAYPSKSDYTLTVSCGSKSTSKTIAVEDWKQPEPAQLKTYYFRATNKDIKLRPCIPLMVVAASQAEAMAKAQQEATNYTVVQISESDYTTACSGY